MILDMNSQISGIQNATMNVVVKYEDKRAYFVKIGLGIMVAFVCVSVLCFLCSACTSFKNCSLILCSWSALMMLVMLMLFILSGILLLIVTIWADFCFDNFDALVTVMSTEDLSYNSIKYFSLCTTYDAVQLETDFPFKPFLDPAKAALAEGETLMIKLVDEVTRLTTDEACKAAVDNYQEIFTEVKDKADTLFSETGPIGCAALNQHLNSVMTLTCDSLYDPISLFFEFFFVIGWMILLSELAGKCLKMGEEVDAWVDDGDDDYQETDEDRKQSYIEG